MRDGGGAQWRLTHASAVLIGARGVLIRGASGSGKSRLALQIMAAAEDRGELARLIGDDQVFLREASGRLLARSPETIAGLIEMRGMGILRVPHEPMAAVCLVIDIEPSRSERLPDERMALIHGVEVPSLVLAANHAPVPDIVVRRLTGSYQMERHDMGGSANPSCLKAIEPSS